MRKYQELVQENVSEIEQLKVFFKKRAELAAEERALMERAEDCMWKGQDSRSLDLIVEAYKVAEKRQVLDETIAEFEDDLRVMLYSAYENVPEHIRRQGFAGFYREAGL